MTRYLKQARLLAGALALVVGLTLVAPPAFAAGPAPDPRPITAAAAAKVEAMPAATLAQATPAAKPPTATAAEAGHKPFFKTTQGRHRAGAHGRNARLHGLLVSATTA